jgi:hypothetical protein
MLRNFGIRKIWLCFPTRLDQWRIGPLDVALTSNAKTNSSGDASNKRKSANRTSKPRLARDTRDLQGNHFISTLYAGGHGRRAYLLRAEYIQQQLINTNPMPEGPEDTNKSRSMYVAIPDFKVPTVEVDELAGSSDGTTEPAQDNDR